MYFKQYTARTALLKVMGSGILGGAFGIFVGSQYDIILNVDAQIAGLVLGSIVGSLLWRPPKLTSLLPAVAAGLGVLFPSLVLLASNRAKAEVVWAMVAVATMSSGIVSLIIAHWKERR